MLKKLFSNSFLILLLGLLTLPLLALLYQSFNNFTYPNFPTYSFSTRWYLELIKNDAIKSSLTQTILLSSICSFLSCFFGFICSYYLARNFYKSSQNILSVLLLPAIFPLIIFGLSFLWFSKIIGIERTFISLLLAHFVVFSPLAVIYFFRIVTKLNVDIENAAIELGASSLKIMEIVLRQIIPNYVVIFIVIMALSWDEYIVSWFLGGFVKSYSVQLRNMLESSFNPQVYAVGVVTCITILLICGIVAAFNLKKK